MDIRRRLLSNDILNNNIFIIESDELLNPIRVGEGCVFWVPLNSEGDEGITDVISGNKIIYHSGGMEFNNDTNMYKFTTTSSNSTYIDINFNSDTFPDNVCTFIAKINILTRNSNLYVHTHSIDDKNIYFQAPINNTAESRTTSYDEGLINAVSYFGDLTYWINNNKKYTMSADSNRRPWAWCNSDIMKFARYVSGTLNSQFEMSNFMIFNRELTSEEINDYIENGIAIQTLYPNCKSLSITANDVSGRDTNTTINYVAEIEYYTENGVLNHTITKTGTLLSAEFPLNTSYDKVIKREIGFKIFGKIAKTTITQGVWADLEYTINLNSQWLKSSITNPDSSLYDGVYESYSNKGVGSSGASMYITINGYENFKLYIRSYAESAHDYVMVSQLDKTLKYNSSYSDISLVKSHTCGSQNSGTSIESYKLVEFTNIDGGEHTILIIYKKDSSVNKDNDCGYVLIPKLQENDNNSGEGDVDIDTTYSILYTSNINNIIAPYNKNYFGANIISNAYVNGLGIITFDGIVTSIGERAFYNCSSLTSITIPNSATSIGVYAFYKCSALTSIIIPNSVTSIGNSAFESCTSLSSIAISNSVTSIEVRAFESCESLTSITIPSSVTFIGHYAFLNCYELTSVYCKSVTPPFLGSYAFKLNKIDRRIYVPAASVNVYKSASGWLDYADYIVGYDF